MPGTESTLALILAELATFRAALVSAGILPATPGQPQPEPQKTGGLFDFVRPPDDEPRYGAGVRMNSPDGAELLKRALYGVRWNGDVIDPVTYDRAWEEIEALKAGDIPLLSVYGESGIDPSLAGVLLLTAYIDPARFRGLNATNKLAEEARKWSDPQAWIQGIFDIMAGGPRVSGGDAPE